MSASVAIDDRSASLSVHVISDDGAERLRLATCLQLAGMSGGPLAGADVIVLSAPSFRAAEAATVRQLVRDHPDARVLIVCRSRDVNRVRVALEAGASGVISSDDLGDALGAAVAAVAAGQICLPPGYRTQVAKPALTTREKQILGLVVMGLSNGEIGRKLYLAESTVKSHLSSAFMKLGVRSRNEATALILDPNSGLGPGILRVTDALGPRTLSPS